MHRWIGGLLLAVAFDAASCAPAPSTPEPAPHIPAPWSYAGDSGPAHWNRLDPEYATCGYGTTQSPIDIAGPIPSNLPGIAFHYQPANLKLRNIGYTVQGDFDEGNSIDVNGESYDLAELRIHAPSEHRIAGKAADAELQLIHRNAAGQLAIVAILLRVGMEDTVLRDMWNNLPPAPGPGKNIGTINLEGILPQNRRTYRYDGSLTTPPCAEIANWFVMRDAMPVSALQLAGFTRMFKSNSRPVQPLNHRMILEDASH